MFLWLSTRLKTQKPHFSLAVPPGQTTQLVQTDLCSRLLSHTEGTDLRTVTDRQRGEQGARRPRAHSDTVLSLFLLFGHLSSVFDTTGHGQERQHLSGRHSPRESEALTQSGNCSVNKAVAARARSESQWLREHVDHHQRQIRRHGFLNDVTTAV